MNRYEDYYCILTGKNCERGSSSECPKAIANIIPWCKWFVNKYQKEGFHDKG